MPAPAVYVVAAVGTVAAVIAFHQFVYEPLIAPKLEAWAESYVESRRRRRRQRQGSVLAQPVREHDDEHRSHPSTDSSDGHSPNDGVGESIELGQLSETERNTMRNPASTAGLRRRRTAGALDESNTIISHPIMTPTHVLFDTSEPPSPGGQSIRTSLPSSVDNSPAHPAIGLHIATPRSPSPRLMSPRLLTPVSNSSVPSSPAVTPPITLCSRRPTPDIDMGASQAFTSAYNTPLNGSMLSEDVHVPNDVHSIASPRIQSPFSDIHSVDAHSSPEQVPASRSPITYPRVQSPSISSDFTLDSDDEFDVLSPRSAIFSPPARVDDPFEVASQHGSEVSWAGVGRRSPVDF